MKKSISLSDQSFEQINNFKYWEDLEDNFSSKIVGMSTALINLMNTTKNELYQSFTLQEICYIVDVCNSCIVDTNMNISTTLFLSVVDANLYEGMGKKWEVDTKLFYEKLKPLTSFQAFVLVKLAKDFWLIDDENLSFKDKVSKVFGNIIKE